MFDAIKKWFANLHKLPAEQMDAFRAEGLVVVDEWIKAKLTYRDFKAPGKRFLYKSIWFKSCVVVTNKRIFAAAYAKIGIDVPFTDERIKRMEASVEDGRLLIGFDASLFQPTWSGRMEYGFTIPDAQKAVDAIRRGTAMHG
jgi:hypothetical protein